MPPYKITEEKRHRQIIDALERCPVLPIEQFIEACIVAFHHEVMNYPNSVCSLWDKILKLHKKAKRAHRDMFRILKLDLNLDTDHLIFKTFQGKRLAETFKEFVGSPET
jgi:hypothetical protein